ncbi:MAG: CRISPR-associated protein Cas6, partial [Desulfobacterota bacterium]|nr:CRISPR-associated protein Cas6 [Thermodesulfobacteriota bacterium]
MLFGNYLFTCEFSEPALLPPYKGSTFRGVVGQALKKVVCVLKRKDCSECLLQKNCVYFFVFETPRKENQFSGKKRIGSPPHPYVIEPPLTDKINFSSGDHFKFRLLLFGKANDYLPYLIYALDQRGEKGVGKRNNHFRGRFILKEVLSGKEIIYSLKEKKITAYQPEGLTLNDLFPSSTLRQVTGVELSLRTPLRVKFQNQLFKDNDNVMLPFHILTRAMLRRIASLFTYYDNGEP